MQILAMKTLFSALYFAFIVDLLSFLKIHSFFSWVYSWCSTDKSATENWERNSPNNLLCWKINITFLVVWVHGNFSSKHA